MTIRKLWKTPLKKGDRLYCYWNLVSKEKNLEKLYTKLKSVNVSEYKVIRMQQGTKSSRILAWRFSADS